ncbi:MAG: hypothetical protein Q3962_02865 [Corynebacterium sp.]|nr:hypothetical protein [Corynebacterium sp.]
MVAVEILEGTKGIKALARHAIALDSQAAMRFRYIQEPLTDILVTTPFNTLVGRRASTRLGQDKVIVRAQDIFDALNSCEPNRDFATADALWPGALPPAEGFQLEEEFPAGIVAELGQKGKDLARQFNGPLGPPKSLLDQTVIEVNNDHKISMRMIFTAQSFGLIPGPAVPESVPRIMRLAVAGHWLRLDSAFGSVYFNEAPSLFSLL